jgi:mycoredoxin
MREFQAIRRYTKVIDTLGSWKKNIMEMKVQRLIAITVIYALIFVLFVFVGLQVGPYARSAYEYIFPEPEYVSGNYSNLYKQFGKSVVMFSTSTCPHCQHARELLQREHVDYTDLQVDQSADAERQFEEMGGEAVPVLYIGNRRITGFRAKTIHDSLALVPR